VKAVILIFNFVLISCFQTAIYANKDVYKAKV